MRILLTFTGFHDPFAKGLVGEDDQPGPILSLLNARSFDLVCLLSTPNTQPNTIATAAAVAERFAVRQFTVSLQDPTDYGAILRQLRFISASIIEEFPGEEYFVSVASGTPQMHACWVLLTASGEFPARILHVRPPRFVSAERGLVAEIDLRSPEFPIVRVRDAEIGAPEIPAPDIQTVVTELGIVADHPKMVSALEQAAALAQPT